ncbi:MAG: RNA methyltransferase [Chloroflexi bacterium]|nr:RNA methyltransferase [Chloroflexota bacterium]
MIKITSLQNPHVKDVLKLTKHQERDARRVTVVEGLREVSRALENGVVPLEAYICPELATGDAVALVVRRLYEFEQHHQSLLFEVTPAVFAKLAYRDESDGVLVIVPYLQRTLEQLPLGAAPFLAVIEGVEKPGNFGAILRTADAVGLDGVIVCAGATDLHNPNVIRASLGTLFTVPVVEAPTLDAITWLRRHQIRIVAATPEAQQRYTSVDMTGPVAIVLGSEANGLGATWLAAADETVSIPMLGAADSLNLATSTALLLYEVIRQRDQA